MCISIFSWKRAWKSAHQKWWCDLVIYYDIFIVKSIWLNAHRITHETTTSVQRIFVNSKNTCLKKLTLQSTEDDRPVVQGTGMRQRKVCTQIMICRQRESRFTSSGYRRPAGTRSVFVWWLLMNPTRKSIFDFVWRVIGKHFLSFSFSPFHPLKFPFYSLFFLF